MEVPLRLDEGLDKNADRVKAKCEEEEVNGCQSHRQHWEDVT